MIMNGIGDRGPRPSQCLPSIDHYSEEAHRAHWSFTRQLAFGNASQWVHSTTANKAFKKFLFSGCCARVLAVIIVFVLVFAIYTLRLKQSQLDELLRRTWRYKNAVTYNGTSRFEHLAAANRSGF